MTIIPDYCLQHLNTLAIAAKAKFFVEVHDNDELSAALKFAREGQLPLLVLGGGSNIVLADDFPGLAIMVKHAGIEFVDEDDDFVYLQVGAGENWHKLVCYCLGFHYWGLENLSLIPGNVGAAPIQNIGAYGVELQDVFSELRAMEIQSRVVVNFEKDACEFAYRDSVFKNRFRDRYVITHVTLKLHKSPHNRIDYPALKQALAVIPEADVTPQNISDAVCEIRSAKLPKPEDIPNAGSFFKNPIVTNEEFQSLQQRFPAIVAYPAGEEHTKLAAAWLIEHAGLKGVKQGGASVHSQQALVLTNTQRGSGLDVLALARHVQERVFEQYAVSLEMEPRVYP